MMIFIISFAKFKPDISQSKNLHPVQENIFKQVSLFYHLFQQEYHIISTLLTLTNINYKPIEHIHPNPSVFSGGKIKIYWVQSRIDIFIKNYNPLLGLELLPVLGSKSSGLASTWINKLKIKHILDESGLVWSGLVWQAPE